MWFSVIVYIRPLFISLSIFVLFVLLDPNLSIFGLFTRIVGLILLLLVGQKIGLLNLSCRFPASVAPDFLELSL
jgi:hypothetical protein